MLRSALIISTLFTLLSALSLCAQDPSIPITELGTRTWYGYEGGLYPGGSNRRPAEFDAVGRTIGSSIQPLDTNGSVNTTNGRIGLISIGMSNCSQEFTAFKSMADADARKSRSVRIVNCAQGGQTAEKIIDTVNNPYWTNARQMLRNGGLTEKQVQIAWLKEANINPKGDFPIHAEALRDQLKQIVSIAKKNFPNLKLVYISSRIYAGYGPGGINPEPFAYESGFSVKWVVEDLMDEGTDPWVAWGPYIWANGMTPREDGLTYARTDLANDGIHPSDAGRAKVARILLDFFVYDATTKPWFVTADLQQKPFCDSMYIDSAWIADDVFPGDIMLRFKNESHKWFSYPILHCTLDVNPYFTADTNMNVISVFDSVDGFNGGYTNYNIHMKTTTDVTQIPSTFQLRGTASVYFHEFEEEYHDTCVFSFSFSPGKSTTSVIRDRLQASGVRLQALGFKLQALGGEVALNVLDLNMNNVYLFSLTGEVVIAPWELQHHTDGATLIVQTSTLTSGVYTVVIDAGSESMTVQILTY